jgi:hypothetical protein
MKAKCINLLRLGLVLAAFSVTTSTQAQIEGEYQIQPIFTRYAETSKKITFDASARVFNGQQYQEVDNFDGWGVDADLVIPIPFTKRFQVRLYYPFYTEGEGRLTNPGQADTGKKIEIEGYGGMLDFPNAQLEYQFLSESNHAFNAAAYAGFGMRFAEMHTTTLSDDVYNHRGKVVLFGLKGDWRCGDEWRFVANAGGRYYIESDDLNPSGPDSDDVFALADVSVAAIYHPWKVPVYPVGELVYQGNFSSYNSVLFVPEVIFGICRNFEFKAGATIGLTSDGESFGGRFVGIVRF